MPRIWSCVRYKWAPWEAQDNSPLHIHFSTKTANVKEGETVAIFGLGAVGLAVVQGAVSRKASRVIAIDTNDGKEEWAKKFGATEFINPLKLEKGTSIVDHLVNITDGGLDYTL